MNSQGDILGLVQRFQDLTNGHRVDDLLDLFNEDAQYRIVGYSNLVGKQEIKKTFEYDAAVNTELRFMNSVPCGERVSCQLLERNDRLKAIGIDELFYTSCIVSLKEGKIQKYTATIEEGASRKIRERVQAFVAWLARQHPVEFSRLFTPEGDFIYSAENGRQAVPLMKEWWSSIQKG
jgi:hypothetical protein